jgi:hypothetical protein
VAIRALAVELSPLGGPPLGGPLAIVGIFPHQPSTGRCRNSEAANLLQMQQDSRGALEFLTLEIHSPVRNQTALRSDTFYTVLSSADDLRGAAPRKADESGFVLRLPLREANPVRPRDDLLPVRARRERRVLCQIPYVTGDELPRPRGNMWAT